MEPTFPSAKDLQAILNTLKQQTVAEEEAVQKFLQTYWESSDDDRQRAADHQRAADQAVQEAQTSRHQLIEHLATYEETMGGVFSSLAAFSRYLALPLPRAAAQGVAHTAADVISEYLKHRILHLDPSKLPSGDQILLACVCVRWWQENALGFALVRDVLTFLRLMSMEQRVSGAQRKNARDICKQLLAPLRPGLRQSGPFTDALPALIPLRVMLGDYERALDAIRTIVRDTHDAQACLRELQMVYPDIPADELRSMVERATVGSAYKIEGKLRPDRMAEALVARTHHLSPDATRKALQKARKDRRSQQSLKHLRPL